MAYAKINSITNANMAKVNNAAKAALGKIGSIDAPSASFSNTYSLDCDGSNDYVTMGDIDVLDSQDTFTISTWIKLDTLPSSGGRYVIVSKDNAYELYVREGLGGSGVYTIYLRINNQSILSYNNTVSIVSISADTWYHYAAVHSSDGTSLYLNGSKQGDSRGSQLEINDVSDSLIIGGRGSYFTNGLIDEVALWTTDLDADAITQIYNSGEPIDLTSNSGNYDNSDTLVGYWRFEEGTGTSVADSSTNSNAGTLVNFSGGGWSSTVPTA